MNILFVDDHTIFREGVASFIEDDGRCKNLFTARDAGAAISILKIEHVDLVITDLNFPEGSGLDILDYLKETETEIPVIVLSMLDELESIRAALQRGARGYITKSSGFNSLSQAMETISTGGYHFDQPVLAKMIALVIERNEVEKSIASDDKKLDLLSDRQKEIFLLLSGGQKKEEIAEKLYISIKTVENHQSQIYKKLGVKDRLELYKLTEGLELF